MWWLQVRRPTRSCSTPGFAWSGQDRLIKAGNYEIPAGTTPRSLLRMLVRAARSLADTPTLVEAGPSGKCARRWPRKTRSNKTQRS